MTEKNKKLINGCGLIVILVSIAIVLFVSFKGDGYPEENDIKEAARSQILHSLKDPSSAEFFHDGKVTKETDSIYVYKEGLKALNGLGLKIPQNAYVKIKWSGDDPDDVKSYILVDVQFQNR